MTRRLLRRDAIRAGIAALSCATVPAWASPQAREVRAFRLIEKEGLRRFGYPVHTKVPDASGGRNFRLLQDGRAIPAQFRLVEEQGGLKEVALDFIASPSPLETARYEVLFGRDVEPGPEPMQGLRIEERNGRILVSQGGGLTFEVSTEPAGFLQSVGNPKLAYLGKTSSGLRILTRGKAELTPPAGSGPAKLELTRHGPIAVGLRSKSSGPSGHPVRVEMTLPSSKTWIEVVATVDDPSCVVAGLQFDLSLRVDGSPTLVDVGAGSTVYGQIRGAERMELVAGRAVGEEGPMAGSGWVVRKGEGQDPPTFAASTPGAMRPAEGWAHVMDARRCTALALAGFGKAGARDRISVEADGRARITREYSSGDAAPPQGAKSIAFWLHFVPMPVQVGALTSPQAMLAPLRMDWDR